MTFLIAESIMIELSQELDLKGVRCLSRDEYSEQLKTLTGGGSVFLSPDVIGGFAGKSRFIPIRRNETSFDIQYNLRMVYGD